MIYVTGDMHGDIERFYSKDFRVLEEHDTLIVAGDFGFVWDGSKKEKKILKYLGSRKYNVCFLDGPHDNYDRINACRETIWRGGRVHRISGTLFHLCRGQIFTIEGCTVFTFGGGESTDKDVRNENQVWFKEELPTPAQMTAGAKNLDNCDCKIDFVITHEPPTVVKRAMQLRNGSTIYTNRLNGYLEELNRNCEFSQWYFGSFHEDKVITPKHTAVYRKLIPINYNEFGGVIIGSGKNIDEEDDLRLKAEKTDFLDEDNDVEAVGDNGENSTADNSDETIPEQEIAPSESGIEQLPKVNVADLFIDDE